MRLCWQVFKEKAIRIFLQLIGNEEQFPLNHRILNIVLILAIPVSILCSLANFAVDLVSLYVTNILSLAGIFLFYYLSRVRRKYLVTVSLVIILFGFGAVFFMWLENKGILGEAPYYIIMCAGMIAVLLSGRIRAAMTICFLGMITGLMVYDHNFEQYPHLYLGLFATVIIQILFFALLMNYQVKEAVRVRDFMSQVDKQRVEIEMARLDGLSLIGEMAASIGHEVRNPLTTVRGYLQFYSGKYHQHAPQFNLMISELDRANAIITEFLSLAKNKKIDMKKGSLNTTIMNLFPLLQANVFRTGHKLQVDTEEIPDILFDDNEIRQLLLNLFRNALEATPTYGLITIATKCNQESVQLLIRDTGPGLPEKILENIGKPFLTTKDSGTGLGLPVCYSIAKRHNAKIEVETSPSGSLFTVSFRIS